MWVDANGLRFACRIWDGGGALVLLLHGFPDDALAWQAVGSGLAAAGYRAVAPFLRGYGSTARAPDGDYGFAALAEDVAALIPALGAERALVVGHDWGAVMAWLGAVAAPERVAGVVGMSVPPLRALLRAARPAQLRRSRYMGAFQIPVLPEWSLRQGGIERLWRRWSPGVEPSPARLQSVHATLAAPGSLRAALGYYRSVVHDAWRRPRRWRAGWRLALQPVPVPATVVYGTQDACIAPPAFADLRGCFTRPPVVHAVAAGHFLPTEAPDAVLAIVREAAHDAFMTQ